MARTPEGKANRIAFRLMAIVADSGEGRVYLPPDSTQERAAKQAKAQDLPDTDLPGHPFLGHPSGWSRQEMESLRAFSGFGVLFRSTDSALSWARCAATNGRNHAGGRGVVRRSAPDASRMTTPGAAMKAHFLVPSVHSCRYALATSSDTGQLVRPIQYSHPRAHLAHLVVSYPPHSDHGNPTNRAAHAMRLRRMFRSAHRPWRLVPFLLFVMYRLRAFLRGSQRPSLRPFRG